MAICIDDQMCSYVRSLFEHPSKWYESYQENGTKYLKSRKKLDEPLQQQLNACAGEIFLCGIPPEVPAEKIAEVASLMGEVYILRFKVHFSGASRGFAYLQYMDPGLIILALQKLPALFRMLNLPMIKVCASRNSSKLLLRKSNLAPMKVLETLRSVISFNKLVGNELSPGYFEYQITFKCNEEAVHARREIMKSILKFGPKAILIWDSSRHENEKLKFKVFGKRPTTPTTTLNKYYMPNQNSKTSIYNFNMNLPEQQQNGFSNDYLVKDFGKMKLF